MNAQEFVTAWIEFINGFLKGKDLSATWHGKTAWTHDTIGPAHASAENSPFVKHFRGRYGEDWRFWKEYRDIDLVLSKQPNLEMPYLWKKEAKTEEMMNAARMDWGDRFLPHALDIAVEQEDSCGISWQEMVKLVHVRAPLKVLITYTSEVYEDKDVSKSSDHIEGTRSMFQTMVQQAWDAFPEDPSTTYLLIIGQMNERGGKARVLWYHSIFTYVDGQVQAVHHTEDTRPS
jgi:hypothetical protein